MKDVKQADVKEELVSEEVSNVQQYLNFMTTLLDLSNLKSGKMSNYESLKSIRNRFIVTLNYIDSLGHLSDSEFESIARPYLKDLGDYHGLNTVGLSGRPSVYVRPALKNLCDELYKIHECGDSVLTGVARAILVRLTTAYNSDTSDMKVDTELTATTEELSKAHVHDLREGNVLTRFDYETIRRYLATGEVNDPESERCKVFLDTVFPGAQFVAEDNFFGVALPSDQPTEYNHYRKDIRLMSYMDVYRTCALFGVSDTSGAIHHSIKKLLATGVRGNKGRNKDLKESLVTLIRALEEAGIITSTGNEREGIKINFLKEVYDESRLKDSSND